MATLVNPYVPITVDDGLELPTDLPALLQRHEDQVAALTAACDSISQSMGKLASRNAPWVTDLTTAQIGYNTKEDMVFLRVGMPGGGTRILTIRPSGIHFINEVTGVQYW